MRENRLNDKPTAANIISLSLQKFKKRRQFKMGKRENGEGTLYIEKRNGRNYYRGQVTIGYDLKGKPIRKSVSGYKKTEVMKKMRILQVQSDNGLNIEAKKFGDYYRNWLFMYKKNEVGNASFKKYETDYRLRLKDTRLSKMKVADIKSSDIQFHINSLYKEGHSTKTLKKTIQYYKECLTVAKNDGIIFTEPTASITIPQDKKETKNYKPFTEEEQKKIINYLDLTDPRDMSIYLGFATGMRKSELLGLKWSDISADGEIHVQRQVKENTYINIDNTIDRKVEESELKTEASYRTIPLPNTVYVNLMRYKQYQLQYIMLNRKTYKDLDLILHNGNGYYMDTKTPLRRLDKICKDLKIEKHQFHSLRHSYATRLFERDVQPKSIQNLLGHSKIETTLNIYTHVLNPKKYKQ